jgi:hypothetical protein
MLTDDLPCQRRRKHEYDPIRYTLSRNLRPLSLQSSGKAAGVDPTGGETVLALLPLPVCGNDNESTATAIIAMLYIVWASWTVRL